MHEARTRFRYRNGQLRPVKRRGKTAAAAERALKRALVQKSKEVAGKKINGDTRFGHVMDLWLADFKAKVERGERAHKSLYDYRDTLKHLRKHMSELTCREAEDAGMCDETLKTIRKDTAGGTRGKSGYSAATRAKTVLSHVCGYAVRHGAMMTNPVRSVETIENGDQEPILVLEPDQRADFIAKLRAECEARAGNKKLGPRAQAWLDLPDLAEVMLATGARPGEALAMIGSDVEPTKRTALIGHHLVRVEGQGIERKVLRKGRRKAINPMYPSWAAPTFNRRKIAAGKGAMFPTWNGQWQDPSNVSKRLNAVCEAIGYGWVSARMYRHTVGTHIVDQGGTNEDAADQLGNTPAMVQKHYRRPKITNTKTAEALESLMDAPDTGS
ncbi:site-specific integrase [Amycolatopsis jejuensis]|uniref:site-specific integrase n=1 Tax=Amycolatopsis jejuensis TaxID=330084 RepID=UPI00138E34A1|nr:site-specific integrase [Amycolatopsis jejuensis]